MKGLDMGFIELTNHCKAWAAAHGSRHVEPEPVLVNTDHIELVRWSENLGNLDGKTLVRVLGWGELVVDESYEAVKQMIREAVRAK